MKQLRAVEQPNRVTVSELNALNPLDYTNKTVYCSASIRKFARDGWWYRSCATSGCYRMVHKNEEAANKYFCPIHGLQKPQPSYSVNMTVEDKESRATLTVMGREAAQLFNSSCQELLEKRFSPTEQSLPEEIGDTMRQAHLFEIKLKPNHGFMVRSISSTENQQLQH
ncbi:PREDICTED: uncharacterized protein LOC101292594 isoform 1 [Fragaria vesca subsp. vesca]